MRRLYLENCTISDLEQFEYGGCYTSPFRLALQSSCGQCMTVTALSRYTGTEAPTIRFRLVREGNRDKPIYASNLYPIGRLNEPTRQQWRVPPMFHASLHTEIEVVIPEGTKLYLTHFHNTYGDPDRDNGVGIRFNAHLGLKGCAPANTRPAVELAAKCGFSTCIINPKEIADGELVCIHDPYIDSTARDAHGNPADDHRLIYEMTWPEINRWDYGLQKDELFRGVGILKLEEFFEICSKTGVKPMFSAHEDALRISGWLRIKQMLEQYGLTKQLHVKSPCMDVLETAFDLFEDGIDSYTLDHYAPEQMKRSALSDAKCRKVIEVRSVNLHSRDEVQRVLDQGFAFSVAAGPNTLEPYSRLIDWGVTEFTVNYHCSVGLNW